MPPPSPNYWCTWSTQSARLPAARHVLAPRFGGDLNRPTTRDSLCEEVLFGPGYEIIPVLVLTAAKDLYTFAPIGEKDAVLPVCSGDMLFNAFDEYLGFLR